jgi:acyl-CoA thioester hydrolase
VGDLNDGGSEGMSASKFDVSLRGRSAYTFWVREHVRFTDLDALGHVSAVRTNEYFNTARASLFRQVVKDWPMAEQLPVMKLAVVQHEQEIHFPADLDVGLVIEGFGKTSLTVVLAVFIADKCLALSRNVFVFIDTKTRLPTPPHHALKDRFMELSGPRPREV